MNWLKKLFGMWDRQEAASERAAIALESIAAKLEAADAALGARIGVPLIEDRSEGNGKRKGVTR